MKLKICTFFGLFAVASLSGQVKKTNNILSNVEFSSFGTESFMYGFQVQTGQTYTPISGGIDINSGQVWDDPEVRIPIPFNCEILTVNNPDSLDFEVGTGGLLGALNYSMPVKGALLIPMESDLIDRGYITQVSQSSIKYVVEGMAPNRILKIQWENCGSFDELDINGTLDEFINFQMWLYEGSNIIEYRYGPQSSTLTNMYWHYGEPGITNGLLEIDLIAFNIQNEHFLSGPANNPTMVNTMTTLVGMPANGTVYQFDPNGLSIDRPDIQGFSAIYPNPIESEFFVDGAFEGGNVTVIDANGKMVLSGRLSGVRGELSDLPKGIYFLKVEKGDKMHLQKVLKN
jgi:hypothetical protein